MGLHGHEPLEPSIFLPFQFWDHVALEEFITALCGGTGATEEFQTLTTASLRCRERHLVPALSSREMPRLRSQSMVEVMRFTTLKPTLLITEDRSC